MRGYCAMGKNASAMPPTRVITTDSTVAKIGRSMKKRESIGLHRYRRLLTVARASPLSSFVNGGAQAAASPLSPFFDGDLASASLSPLSPFVDGRTKAPASPLSPF